MPSPSRAQPLALGLGALDVAEAVAAGGLVADRGQPAAADDEEHEAQEQAEHEALGEAGEADAGHHGRQDGAVGAVQAPPLQDDPLAHELEPDEHDQPADHEGRDQANGPGPASQSASDTRPEVTPTSRQGAPQRWAMIVPEMLITAVNAAERARGGVGAARRSAASGWAPDARPAPAPGWPRR